MKKYQTENIRNVGFFGHGSSGKTTLGEAILFDLGLVDRFGKVSDGNTASDFDPDEIKRQISIYTTTLPVEYKDTKVNILDTPGFLDFFAQAISALTVVDTAVFLVSAPAGVEVGLERTWKHADKCRLSRLFFINKMDKENSDFYKCLDQIHNTLPTTGTIVPMTLPIGSADKFKGIVDLVNMTGYTFNAKEKGKPIKVEIPGDMQDKVKEYRDKLVEAVAGTNDELTEKFLMEEELTQDEIRSAFAEGIKKGLIIPVMCGSAEANIGILSLLDTIVDYFPAPSEVSEITVKNPKTGDDVTVKPSAGEPLSGLVFKTTTDPYVGKLSMFKIYSGVLKSDKEVYNPNKDKFEKIGEIKSFRGKNHESIEEAYAGDIVTLVKLSDTVTSDTLCDKDRIVQFPEIPFPKPLMSMAVFPKSKGDEEKLSGGLAKILEEDPTFRLRRDKQTKEVVVSGMGELHLEIIIERLKRRFGADVELKIPRIPYLETIKGKTQVEYKHKKQSGGRGQYGHVVMEMEPLARGQEFEFVDKIVGGVIPKNFIPSVEKGIRKAMEEGCLAGFPVADVRVLLTFGSYHVVDSSDMAFQIAGSMGFKKGFMQAKPVLLEPIMNVEIIVPDSFAGDCIGDMNSKRGRIQGMEPIGGGMQSIKAQVPLAEMQRYSIDLRSITQGRGTFDMTHSHYEEVPAPIAEPIIASAQKNQED